MLLAVKVVSARKYHNLDLVAETGEIRPPWFFQIFDGRLISTRQNKWNEGMVFHLDFWVTFHRPKILALT